MNREESIELEQAPSTRLTARSKRWLAFWTLVCLMLFMAGGLAAFCCMPPIRCNRRIPPIRCGSPCRRGFPQPDRPHFGRERTDPGRHRVFLLPEMEGYRPRVSSGGIRDGAGNGDARIIDMLNNGETVPPDDDPLYDSGRLDGGTDCRPDRRKLRSEREDILELREHPDGSKRRKAKRCRRSSALADMEGLAIQAGRLPVSGDIRTAGGQHGGRHRVPHGAGIGRSPFPVAGRVGDTPCGIGPVFPRTVDRRFPHRAGSRCWTRNGRSSLRSSTTG